MINKRLLWIGTILLGMAYIQADEPMKIQSGEAAYNGKEISLSGHVVVEHELGTISTHHLTVIPETHPNQKMRFSFLTMHDDIVLDLKDGSQFRCQEAELDEKNLRGIFKGSSEDPSVVFRDPNLSKNKAAAKATPLELRSRQMEIRLIRSPSSRLLMQEVQAHQEVKVNYNDDFIIASDQANYVPIDPQVSKSGILTLSSSEPNGCTVTHRHGDQIQSKQIVVDTLKRELTCYQSKGVLCLPSNSEACETIHFAADKLIWSDKDQLLTLQDHVHVYQPGVGDLKTDHEMKIHRKRTENNKNVPLMSSVRNTEITYQDEKRKLTHKILCYGPLTLDHQQGKILMQSPMDEKGEFISDKQVYFEDLMSDLYADQVQLNYQPTGRQLNPTRLTLWGHVKILNRFAGHLQEAGSVLQYALADVVDYLPQSKEMTLSGKNGHRVLFFDKVNSLQMSAPSLKVKRGDGNQKDSIRGSGDVRFTFIERESERFNKIFPKEP